MEMEMEGPAPCGDMVVAPREPGKTAGRGQANLETCLDGRVASVMGPPGAAMGSDFADMFDLSESLDDIPTRCTAGDQDGALTIWAVGKMLGRRTVDPR